MAPPELDATRPLDPRAERVAVLGASGTIGRALLPALAAAAPGVALWGTALTDAHPLPGGATLRRLDVHDSPQLAGLLQDVRPTTVVLATRFPRGADYEPGQRDRDVKLARRLAAWLEKTGGRLVLLSTSSIYSGALDEYREEDPPDPTTRYGESRVEMERQIHGLACPALVLRLTRTEGTRPGRATRFSDLVAALRARAPVKVHEGFRFNPLSAAAAARAIARLWAAGALGTWHLGGAEALFDAEWATRVAAVLGLGAPVLEPVPPEPPGARVSLVMDPARARRRLRALGLAFPPPLDQDIEAMLATGAPAPGAPAPGAPGAPA